MKALAVLKKKNIEEIEKHLPAKHAKQLTEDERTDIERFLGDFDEAILGEREPRPITTFHPSSLGIYAGKCQRRFVYLFRGVEPVANFDARTLRVFANGTDVHTRIQATIDKLIGQGYEHEPEVRILYDNPPISGYADGVLKLPWNGREVLLEHKSINENGFIGRKKWKAAKKEHVDQANLYAYILGIDTIWFIYENKNDQCIDIYEHKMDPKAAQKILKTWEKTWKMHQEGKLPVRPYKFDSQACQSCDVREHCFADNEVGE